MKYLSARERFLPFHIDVYAAVYKTKGHNFLSNKKKFYSRRLVGFFFFLSFDGTTTPLPRPEDVTAVTCHPCLATPTTLNAQMTGKPQLSGFSLTSKHVTSLMMKKSYTWFSISKKKIFQVEMKKNFLSLFLVYKIWINRNTSGVYNKVREDYSLLTWNTNTSGDGCLWPCCPSAKTNDHGLLHIHKLSGSWCVSTRKTVFSPWTTTIRS